MANNSITVEALQEKLINAKIPKEYYNLNGYKEEALCMERSDNIWLVYEGERGNKFNVEEFNNEADACIAFLKRIRDFI